MPNANWRSVEVRMKQALLALLLCGSVRAEPAPDMTAYGFTFGQPVPLPECAKDQYGYLATVKQPCFRRLETMANGGSMKFPVGEGPRHGSASFRVDANGALELLIVGTVGVHAQNLVFDDLLAKYGKPASNKTESVGNAMGAKFEAIRAIWLFDNLEVHFSGIENRIDHGLLLIGNPAAIRAHYELLKRLTGGERRPL